MEDSATLQVALARARIIADPRKFREYVLVPGHSSGKDRIFVGTLGFRPGSATDALELARLHEEQARAKIASDDVELGDVSPYGRRCTIVIDVRGVDMRTGWRLRDDGTLWLSTPFSGFVRDPSRG